MPGQLTNLVIDPQDSSTLYAGTFGDPEGISGGVFKSTNGGTNWSRTVMASNVLTDTLSVNTLAVHPQNHSTVYAGIGGRDFGYGYMGSSGGVLKSTDGGTSWSAVNFGLPDRISVSALAINSQDTSTVYVGTGGGDLGYFGISGGVFKSTDGGESWSPASSGLPGDSISSLVMDPQNLTTVYAGTRSGVFKSADGGMSWANTDLAAAGYVPVDRCFAGPVCAVSSLVINPQEPGAVFAGSRSGIFKSTDRGASWSRMNYPGLPPAGSDLLALDPQNPDNLYSVAGGSVFAITFASPALTLDSTQYCIGAS